MHHLLLDNLYSIEEMSANWAAAAAGDGHLIVWRRWRQKVVHLIGRQQKMVHLGASSRGLANVGGGDTALQHVQGAVSKQYGWDDAGAEQLALLHSRR